jgi:hypothetical protein
MGPKNKFTREQIIDAAFEIAQTEGINNITMRKNRRKNGQFGSSHLCELSAHWRTDGIVKGEDFEHRSTAFE